MARAFAGEGANVLADRSLFFRGGKITDHWGVGS